MQAGRERIRSLDLTRIGMVGRSSQPLRKNLRSSTFYSTFRLEANLQPYVIKQGDHLAYTFGFDVDTVCKYPNKAQLQ
jgi:hypothetical protein